MTNESKLQNRIQTITKDFGQVLHTYSQTMFRLSAEIGQIFDTIRPDPFDAKILFDKDKIEHIFQKPVFQLYNSLNDIIMSRSDSFYTNQFSIEDWHTFENQYELLSNWKNLIKVSAFRIPALFDSAIAIMEFFNRGGERIKNEYLNDIKKDNGSSAFSN